MPLDSAILGQRRLVLLVASAISLAGLVAWFLMPRQEDPSFPDRNGLIVAPLPGADAARVERLVVEPIESALADVDDIADITSSARSGVGVLRVRLRDTVADGDPIWDDVQERLDDLAPELPDAAGRPRLDADLSDVQSVIVAISGSDDRLELLRAAEHIEDLLLAIPRASRVTITPPLEEQITVAIDDASTRRVGLSRQALADQIRARTQVVPGGTVTDGTLAIVVDPRSDFSGVDAIGDMPIVLPGRTSLPLAQLADVRRTPKQPTRSLARFNGQTALTVGVTPQRGIDVVAFGEEVQRALDDARPALSPLSIDLVTNQPDRVADRLADLGGSLLLGALVVSGVLFVFMGLRLGAVVGSIVPLVTFSSLALYAFAGGILQQISIAALVLSLGLLVDNAIVVAERVQARLDAGEAAWDAAANTIRELAWPLFTATGTTIASFVPLLLSQGPTGDFTRAIPQLVMLTLAVSFLFAITVTPTLAAVMFRPRHTADVTSSAWLQRLARVPGQSPGTVVLGALGLVAVALAMAPLTQRQFFPAGDRNQAVLTLQLEEGTHLHATSDAAMVLERALWDRPEVTSMATFVGRSTPRFYYNLLQRPEVPHVAQILVTTETSDEVEPLIEWAREVAAKRLPGEQFIARKIEQGPPLDAPLEFRLFGSDVPTLWAAANEVHQVLRAHPGTTDVRHDLGRGTPTVALGVVDESTARRAIAPASVASAVLGQTRGLSAGAIWTQDEPIPIVVRSPMGERFPIDDLPTVDVWSPRGPSPLASHATTQITFRPSVIHRRDRERLVTVAAQLTPGTAFNEALAAVEGPIEQVAQRHGLALEIGGEAKGSGEANDAILVAAPIGGVLLLVFLLAQFRSFRRVGIILMTVPLAATGVIPGLVLTGQPFGFTSLLGVFALIGIVVNNAIILVDWIDQRREEGAPLADAVADGVVHRTRPILLTTATTIVGLLPLLFSSSTLWPPLASALISGLAASTGLTLLVVPALYVLIFRDRPWGSVAAWIAPALLVLASPPAGAADVHLDEVLDLAVERSSVKAATSTSRAAAAARDQAFGAAFLPVVGVQATATRRNQQLVLDVPESPIEIVQTPRDTMDAAVILQVPVLDAPRIAAWQAARARHRQQEASERVAHRTAQLEAALACLSQWDLDADIAAVDALVGGLEEQEAHTRARLSEGRALRSDLLQVQVALADAREQRFALTEQQSVAALQLATALGVDEPTTCVRPVDAESWVVASGSPQPRPELEALDAAASAVRRQRASVHAAWLPSVSLEGRFTATNNAVLNPNRWVQGSVVASWSPIHGGARLAADRQLTHQLGAIKHQRDELLQGLQVAQGHAAASLAVAKRAVPARQVAQAQAAEAARLVAAQYAEGRATVSEVLRAQAAHREQLARVARAEHMVLRAGLQFAHAVGAPLRVEPGSGLQR